MPHVHLDVSRWAVWNKGRLVLITGMLRSQLPGFDSSINQPSSRNVRHSEGKTSILFIRNRFRVNRVIVGRGRRDFVRGTSKVERWCIDFRLPAPGVPNVVNPRVYDFLLLHLWECFFFFFAAKTSIRGELEQASGDACSWLLAITLGLIFICDSWLYEDVQNLATVLLIQYFASKALSNWKKECGK